MAKIKIVEKFQGQAMMRMLDEPWQKLIKLEQGSFSETSSIITFKTVDGLSVTADKTNIFEEDEQKISYSGNMKDIGGPQIIIDKLKSKKDFYVLRSFYPGSFIIVLTTDLNFQVLPELPFKIDKIQFLSENHIRYQNGQIITTSTSDSQGHNKGANRGIQVETNISGGEGYTVTMFNMDGNHPLWGDNIQMAPKQMKLISIDNKKIILRGFGQDAMGGSFEDYGLSIFHNGIEPTKLKLHMYDKNVDIEYFKSNKVVGKEPEIVMLAKQALTQFENENISELRKLLVQIYNSVKSDPKQLNNVTVFENLGKAFLLMLDQNLTNDFATLQMIVSIGYLCVSKAIEKDSNNANLHKDRLFLMEMGREQFTDTVKSALNLKSDSFFSSMMPSASLFDIEARDTIYKMEIADIELTPILYRKIDFFREKRNEFDQMIINELFLPERTKENIIKSGLECHNKLLSYLKNRVLNEADIDFYDE